MQFWATRNFTFKYTRMKIFLVSFLLIVSSGNVNAQQIVNDDCTTAVELFVFPVTTGTQQCDNAIPSWIGGDNVFRYATPSVPYYSMTGCQGYSNSTTVNTDDVWLKFKANTNSRDIWLYGDSMNIAFYHGTDCSSLLPSGCFTYSSSYADTIIRVYTSSDTSEFNFIQISSIAPGRVFTFDVCVYEYGRANLVLPFGSIQISTNLDESNSPLPIYLFPNPCQNTIRFASPKFNYFDFYLFDMYGRKIRVYTISEKVALDVSDLLSGIYYYEMREVNGKIKTGKLVKE